MTYSESVVPCSAREPRVMPIFSLEGKVCVVTGAARGLGKEFLTAFALSGAKGACVDMNAEGGESSIAHIREHVKSTAGFETGELKAYACDVTAEDQVNSTVQRIIADFGRIDVLVTAAGIVDNVEAENYEFRRWRKMMSINVDGTWLFARAVGSHMLEQGIKGSIILIGSMSAKICVRPQKQAAYNAAKAAVVMLCKSLATEWASRNIRVNSLSPGYFKTDLIKNLLEDQGREKEEVWVKDMPMGRMGRPSELQGAVVFMTVDTLAGDL